MPGLPDWFMTATVTLYGAPDRVAQLPKRNGMLCSRSTAAVFIAGLSRVCVKRITSLHIHEVVLPVSIFLFLT